MSYLALKEIYGEHNLKKGDRVVRISAIRDGKPWTKLFLYETGASFAADEAIKLPGYRRTYDLWDGVEDVSCDSGD